ncbi:MAG: excinuclease ABC subunit UvrC [Rikenellaceae bacterium]|jgi:excinuclease ABC subunit C|nr:excinuclease ABC subunit UvrC [Rikenellaceae bacterium]
MSIEELKRAAAMLPLLPGVYKYLNAAGTVIYVGKAKSLRKRVTSYFVESSSHTSKVKLLVRQIARIEHIVVGNEVDALLLENNLIKKFMPRYNILLKDDKSYPWIVVRNEPFPRVESTRRLVRDGSRYFGPYASGLMQKTLLELIHHIYPLRTCSLRLTEEAIRRGKFDLCLQYHIGNCLGPCRGRQTAAEYEATVRMAAQILKGDMRSTRDYLESEMRRASDELRFEAAGGFRARLRSLENYQSKSVIVSSTITELDVFSLLVDQDVAYCNYVHVVGGAVVNTFTVELSLGVEQEPQEILTQAVAHISSGISGKLAQEAVVPFLPHHEMFPKTTFTVPQRGDKLKLLEFSQRGAKLYRLEKLKNIEIKDPQRHTERIMEAMRKALRMAEQPRHIECFDNSNLQGTNPVAACVVFRDGKPARREYRHFNVKTVVGADDFATMREIIHRRYSRMLAEGASLPNLIVIDGGKGQLRYAHETLQELGIADRVALVSLAKRIEEVYYPDDPMPYYLERGSEPLKVIMHLRDEAHRFGITFHRQKRSNAFIHSELEAIPGLGPQSIAKLFGRFKTLSAIKKADPDQLAEILGKAKANLVTNHFKTA